LTIPDLLESTRARLIPLLQALQDIQKFHLVEFEGERGTVRLTAVGAKTATVAQKNDIRDEAERLLEPAGKRDEQDDDHDHEDDHDNPDEPGSEDEAHAPAHADAGSKSNPDETE
jgi:hypothetical protein